MAGVALSGSIHAEEDVHVGMVNSTTDASFFIADANGYFREEGLHVEFVSFDSAAKMVPSLGTGELDAGGGAVSSALYNAVARGVEVKVVADKAHHDPNFGHAALLVRKVLIDSGRFQDFKDLRGLKVALSGAGSSDESVLNEALKRGGLKWGDATVVYMGFPQQPAAFANGAIDAALTSEPALTNALKTGTAALFARIGQFYPNQQSAAVIYGVSFLKSKPDTAKKFMRAYIRGARFYNDAIVNGALDGPTAPEVISILAKYSLIKNPDVYKATTPPAINPDGRLNIASMRKDWQFFKDTRQIDGSVTVEEVVDMSFVEDAVASLGPYRPNEAK
jgi:NitT/TauT family transport system substrate-binding protein